MKRNRDKELDLVEQFDENENKSLPALRSDDDRADVYYDYGVDDVIFPNDVTSIPITNSADQKRDERREREEARQEKRETLHRSVYAIRYCTTCGALIIRTGESRAVWCKVRRCAECLENGRQSTRDRKYCSSCGKDFSAELTEAYDWRTKAVCSACAGINKVKSHVVHTLR